MNLGWKLAATIRGDAPEGLLDSDTTERHPVGARILDWTRAQVALLRPSSSALGAIVRDLIDFTLMSLLRHGPVEHGMEDRSCGSMSYQS